MAFITFDTQTFIEEAYTRALIPLESLTARHNKEALNSLVLIGSKWSTQGLKLWQLKSQTVDIGASVQSFIANEDCLDIFHVYRTNDGVDQPLEAITLMDFQSLPNKAMEGTPSVYMHFKPTNNVTVWPACAQDTSFTYTYIARSPDAIIGTNLNAVPYQWWDALAAELAYRLASKYPKSNPTTLAQLKSEANEAYRLAYFNDGMVGQTVSIGYAQF